MSNEYDHIEKALETVKSMLLKKKDIWTAGTGPFHQFDAMEDMHITPEQFGLIMCQLKMNRVKTVFEKHYQFDSENQFKYDPDAEDSLIDLASYALLTLGLIYRARETQKTSDSTCP